MKKKFYSAPARVAAALLMLLSLAAAGYAGYYALLTASLGCYSGEYYESSLFWHAEEKYLDRAELWYQYSQRAAAGQQEPYNEQQYYAELTEVLQNSSLRAIRVGQDGVETPIAGTRVTQVMEELPYFYYGGEYGYKMYFDTSRSFGDNFEYYRTQYIEHYPNRWHCLAYGGAALSVALLAWLFLLVVSGHSTTTGEISLRGFHRFPFDVLTAAVFVLCALITLPIEEYMYLPSIGSLDASNALPLAAALVAVSITGGILLILLWLHTAIARLKGRRLLRSTLIWMICAWIWRKLHGGVGYLVQAGHKAAAQHQAKQGEGDGTSKKAVWHKTREQFGKINWRHNPATAFLAKVVRGIGAAIRQVIALFRQLNVIWKLGAVTIVVMIVLETLAANMYYQSGAFLLLVVLDILVVLAVSFFAVQLERLKKGGERLAGGDLDYKTPTEHMYWDLQEHAKNLNAISDGMAAAVEERLKSERMKYELLTNVSHDIKTPLTSIINYVDLLKNEPIPDGPAKEYVEVLERQSARLKKLITDLIDVSKATTGNITVHAERMHAGELLRQCIGEYDDRFQDKKLEVVLNVPEQEPSIYADGRLLWRVFDNLLGNIVKYAMPGTRVYMDLETKDNQVIISLKNISRERLNVAADELMERFVRGDASRATEGSGLGLSIAQSLTELMQGRFELMVDGDLFKIVLIFRQMEN